MSNVRDLSVGIDSQPGGKSLTNIKLFVANAISPKYLCRIELSRIVRLNALLGEKVSFVTNKIAVILLILSISPDALACFDGSRYAISAQESWLLGAISAGILCLCLAFRLYRKRGFPYFLVGTTGLFLAPVVLEILRWGNGDCGIGLVKALNNSAIALVLLLSVEVFLTIKRRLGGRVVT